MLLLMVLAAIPLAWKVNRVHKQRRAVATIIGYAGSCRYEGERAETLRLPFEEPPARSWLRQLLGEDYFDDVTWAALAEASEEQIERLEDLPKLSQLTVYAPEGLRDEALEPLGRLNLVHLRLDSPRLAESTMAALGNLSNLTVADVISNDLTDAKLAGLLERWPNLRYLTLTSSQLTDVSLVRLETYPGLLSLDLRQGQFSEYQIARLKAALPGVTVFVQPGKPGMAPNAKGP